MADFFDIMNQNEIDGKGENVEVTALQADPDWTVVMHHPAQDIPEGHYDFWYSFQTLSDVTAKDFHYKATGSITLPDIDMHIDKLSGYSQHMYMFTVSWDGGPFELSIEMAKKNDTFTLMCEYCEFSLKRRS